MSPSVPKVGNEATGGNDRRVESGGKRVNLHARHCHDKRQPPSSLNIIQVRPRRVYKPDLNVRNGICP